MSLYSRIDTMKRTSVTDYGVKDVYKVYKFKCDFTGLYYIGCTGTHIDERISGHIKSIQSVIEFGPANSLNFHRKVSERMKQEYDQIKKKKKLYNFLIGVMSVEILAVVSGKEAALVLEKSYISKRQHDPLCCNVSGY